MTSNDEYVIQLLTERGYLTQDQVDAAAQSMKAENETTLDVLLAGGTIGEDEVLGTIADQFGLKYCHINANGDVEPCVFIHYSSANIKEKTLLECLQQPLFKAYRDGQPFNDNLLRPCPMLENPEKLVEIIKATGAKSTDLEAEESVEHLCSKCTEYAEHWKPTAEKLWAEEQKARS